MNTRVFSPAGAISGSTAGFTLIELLITLSVFILLTASVFGILGAVLQSSNELQANQNRRDDISAFQSYLRHTFEQLAAQDSFVTYRRDDTEGLDVSGVIVSVSGAFEAFDASRQSNGLYRLRLARSLPDRANEETVQSFTQKLQTDQGGLVWRPLLSDISKFGWKFRSGPQPDWDKEWTNARTKPTLVECTLELAGDAQPSPLDFLIPNLVEVSLHQPPHAP